MSQSIWGASAVSIAKTNRIPVDTSSSSSPGNITVLDIINITLSSQTGNAGRFLTTNGTDASWSTIAESNITLVDNTTNNSTTSKHGFLPKLSGSVDDVFRGDGTFSKVIECIALSPSDDAADLTTGTSKVTFRSPYNFTITAVKASLTAAPVGSTVVVDINKNGTSILSTKLSIDATETTSKTAATPAVISTATLLDDDEITVDIDQIGSSTAGKGLKVYILGYRNI